MKESVWIGWEPREAAAYAVARHSIQRHLSRPIPVHGLELEDLTAKGLYRRPIYWHGDPGRGVMMDVISDAPMSTSFACSRFLVPHLAKEGWALFLDCDFLVRADLAKLFDALDPKFAAYCVKHDFRPKPGLKMDSQHQTSYDRKLWSSFIVFNCDHPANKALTLDMINSVPGRDLHRLAWLKDEEIGALDEAWNWVPGHSPDAIEPNCIHWSEGGPWFSAYQTVDYAKEWKDELRAWIA